MSDTTQYVRRRLRAGDVAVYEHRGRTCYLYRRDDRWRRFRVKSTPYLGIETQLGGAALDDKIEEHRPEVVETDKVPIAVRVAVRDSAESQRLAAEWMREARDLVESLEDGDAGEAASEMISVGHRLADRLEDGEREEKVRARAEEIGRALND